MGLGESYLSLPALLGGGAGWLSWIFAGGVAYTIGIIFYLAGSKTPTYALCLAYLWRLGQSFR